VSFSFVDLKKAKLIYFTYSNKKHVLYRLLSRAHGIFRFIDPTLDMRSLLNVTMPFLKHIIVGVTDNQLKSRISQQQLLDLKNDPDVDIMYVN
jgi:hypothetical protein